MVLEDVDGLASDEEPKKEAGCAMRTTPTKETAPASCSLRVNVSARSREQTQFATMGAMKVITVASARGRYRTESASV